ncbi:energy-coupling factor ABC transporter permease [Candidatus Margulisiibacteriota bacterium]
MHIPNGLLDPKIATGSAFAAAAVLGYCIAKVKQALVAAVPEAVLAGIGNVTATVKGGIGKAAENHFVKMGAIGALIFAGQMFNFPVAEGTSGHLLGGIIAAVALGPFSGAIVIAAVLFVQSIFFADGGIMVLGANILNMAIIGSFACYYIYYNIYNAMKNKYGFYLSVGLAAFSSVLIASIACSLEIAWSGTVNLGIVLPAMASVHAVIGISEALITIMALEILRSLKFDLEGEIK